ncbi:unnamed protein product [Spirodela intermedia]|uniref:ABC transporter domain-containing protein n=1 Tax=Spirodela intermedia TaxID=51605 RepID=A0A7I8JQT4_SPIIN|nr:unnamed protein product [Spirodela intermedia]CAA6672145.1 unnamed protein product [Spirodela intermedia]
MALPELSRSAGSSRTSMGRRRSGSFRELWTDPSDVFHSRGNEEDDEATLRLAALWKLAGSRREVEQYLSGCNAVDVASFSSQEGKIFMDSAREIIEDNERLLRRLRERIDRVGIEMPKIEIRFENLSVEADAYVGKRALPTLLNSAINAIEGIVGLVGLSLSKKAVNKILTGVSGILKPSRMVLLLGPPGSGKTTLLLALAGKLDKNGGISYCGHALTEFIPQRTSAYIGQHDLHLGEMTVRETLGFSGRCLGVGSNHEMLLEMSRLEREAGINPDPEIETFMKGTMSRENGQSVATDHILKMLGLDACADVLVGDEMRRGISGGQKKRVTVGEMLVGPARALFMDEISNGLDASTAFQIVKFLRQIVHTLDVTMVISLLQPAPETFDLFDDIILLSEGKIVYQVHGFKCPERKGIPEFLQEVTSRNDQEQYWTLKERTYRYISVNEFVEAFNSFHIGMQMKGDLEVAYDRSKTHPAALAKDKYGNPSWELFKVCFTREWLLMKKNAVLYIFKTGQLIFLAALGTSVFPRTQMHRESIADGGKYLGALFYGLVCVMFNGMAEIIMTVVRLPVHYKQRDLLFYPSWAFGLPLVLLKVPISLLESAIWVSITYYGMGFAPPAGRFFRQILAFFWTHQVAMALFRFIGAAGRSMVAANSVGVFGLLIMFALSGFVISKDDLDAWWIWGYWTSPMMYGQNALAINEFLDSSWGKGDLVDGYWYWISIGALILLTVFYNLGFVACVTYLDGTRANGDSTRGIVLPFKPLSLSFNHVNYYVDMPAEMKGQGTEETYLQLLCDVSGAFRPGILTALVGVSGAGKTTLMDVLAGRKTGGYIEGDVSISGYPKNQATFARVTGYCEQNDIHSPNVTVYESLVYSAWLRLPPDVKPETKKTFVEEVMALIELDQLRDALVGLPGVNGLSTEQRKRFTVAVELVANPSIIFMDEPTSGLDARSAAIVMRTVRNTVNTGRTVVCTIHQPSIDIFESFDELILMKLGGQVIYAGPLGQGSRSLIEYFEAIPGVPKIKEGQNPATWMLQISVPSVEAHLNLDFADIYSRSSLYQKNQHIIEELSTPAPGSQDLYFPTKYAQSFVTQCTACFWKQHWSYWKNPSYNAVRFFTTVVMALIFGTLFWNKGQQTNTQQDVLNLMGAVYCFAFFLGFTIGATVQPVVAIERTVFYRERAAGMYSAFAYAFAQVGIEVIYIAGQALVYCLICYSMIGFSWQVDKFLWFIFLVFMCFLYFGAQGMMSIAITPAYPVGGIVMLLFFNFWNIFSGFLIYRPMLPKWWTWCYWTSPVAWTIYGLIVSQFGDSEEMLQIPGQPSMTVKAFLKEVPGYERSFLGYVAVAHIGFVTFFSLVFAFGIKFINFQRR